MEWILFSLFREQRRKKYIEGKKTTTNGLKCTYLFYIFINFRQKKRIDDVCASYMVSNRSYHVFDFFSRSDTRHYLYFFIGWLDFLSIKEYILFFLRDICLGRLEDSFLSFFLSELFSLKIKKNLEKQVSILIFIGLWYFPVFLTQQLEEGSYTATFFKE